MSRLAACVLVLLLPGCALDAAIKDMERASDQRACDGFGFRRDTDAYANCMMQQSAQRAEDDQRSQDRFQRSQAADKWRRGQ